MKIFRVDTSLKYINFELDGKRYSIHFRSNIQKGIHDVSVWMEGRETSARITETYPPLKTVLADLWQIHFPLWLEFKARQRCKNRWLVPLQKYSQSVLNFLQLLFRQNE